MEAIAIDWEVLHRHSSANRLILTGVYSLFGNPQKKRHFLRNSLKSIALKNAMPNVGKRRLTGVLLESHV